MPPADTLDGELLKTLLDESSLPRAVRGAAANNLVEMLEETLSGAISSLLSRRELDQLSLVIKPRASFFPLELETYKPHTFAIFTITTRQGKLGTCFVSSDAIY